MQRQQGSRINLAEQKAYIVNKIGVENARKYLYILSRFLSNKLSKSDFDKSCYRLLGRENLPLHNQLVRSILKNACQAKTPPPIHETVPAKSLSQTVKDSLFRGDASGQSGSLASSRDGLVRSNGVLPGATRKVKTEVHDRNKLRDRLSSLGPNGNVDCLSYQSLGIGDCGREFRAENGDLGPHRPRNLQSFTGPSENERVVEEMEQSEQLQVSKSPLVAPLGISFCHANVGGVRRSVPFATSRDIISCYDSGTLFDSETLKKYMEKIAEAQGIGEVSLECANTLNNMLDLYLKKLIKSCAELVETRSTNGPGLHIVDKQQMRSKAINGMWSGNNTLRLKNSTGPLDVMYEQKLSQHTLSLLDFRVAMELNPQQLGQHWALLLEKICMHSFEG